MKRGHTYQKLINHLEEVKHSSHIHLVLDKFIQSQFHYCKSFSQQLILNHSQTLYFVSHAKWTSVNENIK